MKIYGYLPILSTVLTKSVVNFRIELKMGIQKNCVNIVYVNVNAVDASRISLSANSPMESVKNVRNIRGSYVSLIRFESKAETNL